MWIHNVTHRALFHAVHNHEEKEMLCFRSGYQSLVREHTALRILESWDLSRVKRYLESTEGIGMSHLDKMEREYKRFHALTVLNPDDRPMPITLHVDPMWHTHILFTADYRRFCEAVYSVYLNHNPTITEQDREELRPAYFENTLASYEKYFGTPPEEFWGKAEMVCVQDRGSMVCVSDRIPVVCVQDRAPIDEHGLLSCHPRHALRAVVPA